MDPMVFPVPLNALAASLMVVEIEEGEFEIDGFNVCALRLRHPGTTLGYRLVPTSGGRQLAYVTDNELGPGGNYEVTPDWRSKMVEFVQGADTLVHDAMYLDQIIQARAGWGHSTPRQAVDLAREGRCRRHAQGGDGGRVGCSRGSERVGRGRRRAAARPGRA